MEMGFGSGSVVLDNNAIYYPGQNITGHINFRLNGSIMISAVNIQFFGAANVLWTEEETEKRNGTRYKTRVDYKGQEEYFNNVQCLLGGEGPIPLNAGPHSIPFSFELPFFVPSSFKEDMGKVYYEVRAFMEYPEIMKEREELVKPFTVVAPLDLNKGDARLKEPLKFYFESNYTAGCVCSPRSLTVDVEVPVTGFCPGQVIPVTVNAKNDSNIEVRAVLLEIICRKRFRSLQPVSEITLREEEVSSARTPAVLSRSQRHYNADLRLPAFLAPNLESCKLIDVQYFLRATVKVSGFNEDLVETCPILIGLKPLANFTDGKYVHPMADSLPVGPIPVFKPQAVPVNPPYPTGSDESARTATAPLNSLYPVGNNQITPGFVVPDYRPNSPGYPKLQEHRNNQSYLPQQYPLNGHVPTMPVNYTPTAPSM